MIEKAKRLKSIGKFYDFSSSANDLDWQKNTFVFAPNAYGKTTFVNVLRSLRDNDPKLIRARKTLGATANPEAVIVIAGGNHVFNGMRWDKPYPDILISRFSIRRSFMRTFSRMRSATSTRRKFTRSLLVSRVKNWPKSCLR